MNRTAFFFKFDALNMVYSNNVHIQYNNNVYIQYNNNVHIQLLCVIKKILK